MEDLTGQSIKGYELLERIGSGGFGAVFRAYQSTIGREVAVKVILPGFANHPEFIRRFEIEAQLIARLEHLHVVPLYDYWREPGNAYLVMRWLRGGSAKDVLKDGAFDLQPATLLMDQIAAALTAAHDSGIIHRDLKPSNILMDTEGNSYLADFGIAKNLLKSNGNGSRDGTVLGSPAYLSPEQARGEAVTPQSDIYSLGITLFELLSGQRPFQGVSAPERLFKQINDPLPFIDTLDSQVKDEVNQVIQRATAKNPKQRYPDALAMAAAFRKASQVEANGQTTELVESLTFREQEILQLIVDGHTNKQIAQELFVEISTVKWHIKQMYRKLGARSRVQAVARARDMELLVPTGQPASKVDATTATGISILLPEPVNPYKGLRAFEPADNRDFFGREALLEHLLIRLVGSVPGSPRANNKIEGERFLAIVGPSGSGKSSLVKAGLIPALWSGKLPGSEKWFIAHLVPGAHPLDELEIALTRIAANQAGNIRGHLDRDNRGLSRIANLILPGGDSELVVVIDQFEELFTLVEDELERDHFMKLIHGAVTNPRRRVRVIITLRADFYDRPLQVPDFGELVRGHMETLLPLSAGELERVIVNPARQVGVEFEAGLVATIIEEVNYRPGALPLLQYALTELFEQRQDRLLTEESYAAIGGAAGALALRAEELYKEQDDEGQEAIRQMFLRLVTAGPAPDKLAARGGADGPTQAGTRRRVRRAELLSATVDPDRLDEIIDTYADYRLLSLDHDPASRRPTVEVAHEAIMREWERLSSWLEESRADLALHRQLIRATCEWLEADGDESFLLRGARLTHFESWVGDTQLVLTEEERSFLETSLARRGERADAERQRQEQEVRLEQRASKRLKQLVVVMALALVVTVGLAIIALAFARQSGERQRLAEEQERLAVARELTSAALANLELNPERSVLLALEAIETTQSTDGTILPFAEDALHQAVQADRIRTTMPMEGALAFNQAGDKLAIGGNNGALALWDAMTGQRDSRLLGHSDLISDLAFSSDGRFLASSSFDGRAILWDYIAGQTLAIIQHEGRVNGIAFSPDGKLLATSDENNAVLIWDITSVNNQVSDEVRSVRITEPGLLLQTPLEATIVAFSPDGQRLAAFVPGSSIFIWDPFTGQQLSQIPGATTLSSGLAFSPDGRYLAGATGEVGVTLWDTDNGQEILTLQETLLIADITFSQDSSFVAIGTKDGLVALWEIETGRKTNKVSGRSSGFNFIALHPDGRQLATGGVDGLTRIWDIGPTSGDEIFTIKAHAGKTHDVVYSPEGTKFATAGPEGQVKLWDASTGELLHRFDGQLDWVHFPAFSPDGRQLAVANRHGGVTVWEVTSGQELLTLNSDSPSLTAITFSPDGSTLTASGKNGVISIWDASSGERLIRSEHDAGIMRIVYNVDGSLMWTYDTDGWAVSWNPLTGERLLGNVSPTIKVCDTTLWDAEISSDGRFWAAAGFDGLAHVFEVNNVPGNQTSYARWQTLEGHLGNVSGIAFHPQESIVATSGFDGTARLWDLETGEEILQLTGNSLPAEGVDFNLDGSRLAVAGADGTVRQHIISVEELVEVARSRLSRDFTQQECQSYLHLPACLEE
jgi:WD40 repeat protein/serine/threonine protein kinase